MKFLITSSLIIGTVFLLGASTSSNAISTQAVAKSSNSDIVKVRGHVGGGMGSHHIGGYHGTHGYYNHHGYNHYGYHKNYNYYGGDDNFYGGPSVYYGGTDYYDGPDYLAEPDPNVCIGPFCLGL